MAVCQAAPGRGFPAHAGMDPETTAALRATVWFPRPRGDGPDKRHNSERNAEVSPPTRGWTCSYHTSTPRLTGFPAHAGMDPPAKRPRTAPDRFPRPRGDGPGFPTPTSLRIRFPRPRGDGPELRLLELRFSMVSPPTRGWTVASEGVRRRGIGFPAHAGMDPYNYGSTACPCRFPRPRGDGPRSGKPAADRRLVSPPTRGWTHGCSTAAAARLGFPAHAGMDPTHLHHHRSSPGFPAHAGMDLYVGTRQDHRLRFPRPRGDGPCDRRDSCVSVVVSPPTRGWTSSRAARTASFRGFPRPRGDGPSCPSRRTHGSRVSPPTRGWTTGLSSATSESSGFPAHAGMDLASHCRSLSVRRFPRPRGDGPRETVWRYRVRVVSPPTRGWTSALLIGPRICRGFPAHAGMDPCRCDLLFNQQVSPPTRGWTRLERDRLHR